MTVEQEAQISAFITAVRVEHESDLKTKTKKNSDDKMIAKWIKDHGQDKYGKAVLEVSKTSLQDIGNIARELAVLVYA